MIARPGSSFFGSSLKPLCVAHAQLNSLSNYSAAMKTWNYSAAMWCSVVLVLCLIARSTEIIDDVSEELSCETPDSSSAKPASLLQKIVLAGPSVHSVPRALHGGLGLSLSVKVQNAQPETHKVQRRQGELQEVQHSSIDHKLKGLNVLWKDYSNLIGKL